VSWIRVLEYVAWFVIAGCFVAVLIHGGYTSTTRIVHGIALGATVVLLLLESVLRRRARQTNSSA
jgi:hypothetical protein